MLDQYKAITYLCGGLCEIRQQALNLDKIECGDHGPLLALVYLTCRDQASRMYQIEKGRYRQPKRDHYRGTTRIPL